MANNANIIGGDTLQKIFPIKKAKRPSWEVIHYEWMESGWCDFEDRPKTVLAIKKITKCISDDELEMLLERIAIIFAPGPGADGLVCPFNWPWSNKRNVKVPLDDRILVYLSPSIERKSQRKVDSTVAHEFAHVVLRPRILTIGLSIKREADKKVQAWGFRPAYKEAEYPDTTKEA